MKKLLSAILLLAGLVLASSCNDYETYADQKKAEREAIGSYISKRGIKVISESDFRSNDSTTDVSKNEYVLLESSGVYMQIVRKGCGEKIKGGETATALCRFTEYNIMGDSVQLSNDNAYFSRYPDKMTVTYTSGVFTASFISGESILASAYGSTSVPAGWLVPLSYVNLGRPEAEGDEIAKVNIIVPHSQGHSYASSYVYPCYYTLTYERGR